mgnify:CR=1 FL=1
MAKLNIKQQKFADEYIISGNATEAAKLAGYAKGSAKQTGNRLVNNSAIKDYIDKRLKELESEKIAEQNEILQYLTSVMRGEVTEQVPIMVGDGVQDVRDIKVSIKDRNKAAELLGKTNQMFTNKLDINSTEGIKIIDDIG